MNNAISVPEELYREAKSQTEAVGITVDEFAIEAIQARVDRRQIDTDEVTEILNKIYAELPPTLDPILSEMQFRSLEKED
ncbi:MAG TPA: hypothetical protein EYN72_09205 [Dehalococcoidia bacterium]|jgi:hypothetical protein|nr:hypothetical protein [SAR202 cluster bacterium]HAC18047.1 hypothetical protein [Dehalococcoidia bacterium]HIA16940.1 hypothetical protein [Dehalococcoidia bacterium]